MDAGDDVTDIEWKPPHHVETGPGDVTIEHRAMEDVPTPMTEDDARRLAHRMFGDDKTELPVTGEGVHWVRKASSGPKGSRTSSGPKVARSKRR